MNVTGPYRWLVNIDLGNGLVPLDNKPLPEPVLMSQCFAKWCGFDRRFLFSVVVIIKHNQTDLVIHSDDFNCGIQHYTVVSGRKNWCMKVEQSGILKNLYVYGLLVCKFTARNAKQSMIILL